MTLESKSLVEESLESESMVKKSLELKNLIKERLKFPGLMEIVIQKIVIQSITLVIWTFNLSLGEKKSYH